MMPRCIHDHHVTKQLMSGEGIGLGAPGRPEEVRGMRQFHNHLNWCAHYSFTLTQSMSQSTKVGIHVKSLL